MGLGCPTFNVSVTSTSIAKSNIARCFGIDHVGMLTLPPYELTTEIKDKLAYAMKQSMEQLFVKDFTDLSLHKLNSGKSAMM